MCKRTHEKMIPMKPSRSALSPTAMGPIYSMPAATRKPALMHLLHGQGMARDLEWFL